MLTSTSSGSGATKIVQPQLTTPRIPRIGDAKAMTLVVDGRA
jgi:hypothetical protein